MTSWTCLSVGERDDASPFRAVVPSRRQCPSACRRCSVRLGSRRPAAGRSPSPSRRPWTRRRSRSTASSRRRRAAGPAGWLAPPSSPPPACRHRRRRRRCRARTPRTPAWRRSCCGGGNRSAHSPRPHGELPLPHGKRSHSCKQPPLISTA